MEWQDTGLVLSTRRHGERDAILEVMTSEHGRHLGLVRGGRSPRLAPVLQPGNRVQLTWRARLEDHLGQFTVEPLASRAGLVLSDPLALHAVTHIAMLVRQLPERDPHPDIYIAANALCDLITDAALFAANLVRFELLILSELGFGLDLSRCAATGETDDLVYVSPKSGRAVSRAAGGPWAERLLGLPPFLGREIARESVSRDQLEAGFRLSGFFLERHLIEPRGLAHQDTRAQVLAAIRGRLP